MLAIGDTTLSIFEVTHAKRKDNRASNDHDKRNDDHDINEDLQRFRRDCAVHIHVEVIDLT